MTWVKVGGETYNLGLLLKFVERTGQREVGAIPDVVAPEPVFDEFRFVELVFVDGTRVELDGPQTEAFLRHVRSDGPPLDLDRVDAEVLGRVIVRDSEGGDVILPQEGWTPRP